MRKRLSIRILAGILAALVSSIPAAQLNAQQTPIAGIPSAGPFRAYKIAGYAETKLPNGLTVVFAEDSRLPLFTARLVFAAGSTLDPADAPGTSAALANILLKGTGSRSSHQFLEDLDSIGSVMTSNSTPDALSIEGSGMAEAAPSLLGLLSDVLRDAQLSEYETDAYRRNRRQALPYELLQPQAVGYRLLRGALFGKTGYGAPGPTPQAMDVLERQTLAEFRAANFQPNNAYLILAGKLPPRAELDQIVAVLFGNWAPGKQSPAAQKAAPQPARRLMLVDRPGSDVADIRVGSPWPAFADADTLPLTMLSAILGNSPHARLNAVLKELPGPGVDVHTEVAAMAQASVFSTVARTGRNDAPEVLTRILAGFERLTREPVTGSELAGIKAYMNGTFVMGLESQQTVADYLVRMKIFNLPRTYLETYTTRVNAIEPGQLTAAAKKWMSPEQASIVVIGDAAKLLQPLEKIGKFEKVDPMYGQPVTGQPMSGQPVKP